MAFFSSCKDDDSEDPAPLSIDNNDEVVVDDIEEEDEDNTGGNTGENSFTAAVNGSPWTPATIQPFNLNGSITITLTNSTDAPTSLLLVLPENIIPGDYDFTTLLGFGDVVLSGNVNLTPLIVNSGSLTIISHDQSSQVITGTFTAFLSDNFGINTVTSEFEFTDVNFSFSY